MKRHSLRVAIVAFPGAQVLDVTGPAAVFACANRRLGREQYDVRVVSSSGKSTPTDGAVAIATESIARVSSRSVDTLLVVGGGEDGLRKAAGDHALRRWVLRTVPHTRRYGSVCAGALLLASYGLLNDRRAATHWGTCQKLREQFPEVQVDEDSLYVVDGPVWTSAGVTTGIDMTLAMVEADLGSPVASAVARQLVVYARRPGFQSQFSAPLRAQAAADTPYGELCEWMLSHLHADLGVEALAKRSRQSARDFHRKFSNATGQTPARFVENLRLDRVRLLLSHELSLKEIAEQAGFGSVVRMSRAFERRFGVKPSLFRQMQ